jgi:hypothetical protein
MKSHTYQFEMQDLLRVVLGPVLVPALFAVVMHLGARSHLLLPPRPVLDTDRTILIHQAEASRTRSEAEVLLLGDSSCLMNVSARRLSEQLGRPVLNLGTFSFLDLVAHATLLREFTRVNPGRPRVIVLLMHPEALRRASSEEYYANLLSSFLAGTDPRPASPKGQVSWLLGADIFKGRLLGRALPLPLGGAYGRVYGFNRNLEAFMDAERGSIVDPDPKPFAGSAEYRLGPTLEPASKAFRAAVPPGAKLLVGISPAPEGFAGPRYPTQRTEMLRQWSQWLKPDGTLEQLPATLPDGSFIRTTHLKESAIAAYTDQLATALKPHL